MKHLIPFFFLTLLLPACKPAEERSCLKSEGEPDSAIFPLDREISSIHLHDDLHVVLVPDSQSYLEIHAGKNMISQVSIREEDTSLTLENNSKCYFLRKFRHESTVYVHSENISEIHLYGFGKVSSAGRIRTNRFSINSWNSASQAEIELETHSLYSGIHSGAANFKFTGKTGIADFYSASYGLTDGLHLLADSSFVDMKGSGDVKVWTNSLAGLLKGPGNLYYKGDPVIRVTDVGSGELKKTE